MMTVICHGVSLVSSLLSMLLFVAQRCIKPNELYTALLTKDPKDKTTRANEIEATTTTKEGETKRKRRSEEEKNPATESERVLSTTEIEALLLARSLRFDRTALN